MSDPYSKKNLATELAAGGCPGHRHRLSSTAADKVPNVVKEAIERHNEQWLRAQFAGLCPQCAADLRGSSDLWRQLEWRVLCKRAIDEGRLVVVHRTSGAMTRHGARDLLRAFRDERRELNVGTIERVELGGKRRIRRSPEFDVVRPAARHATMRQETRHG